MLKLTVPRSIEIGQLYSITWRNGIEKKDGQIIEYDAKPSKEMLIKFLNTVL